MLAVALLAVFLAVGCGGDDDSGSSDAPSTTEWAQGLCSAIGDWTSSVSSATGSLKGDNLSEEGLKSAVDDVESATDTFVDDMKGLGSRTPRPARRRRSRSTSSPTTWTSELAKIESATDGASGVKRCPRRRLDSQRDALDDESADRLHLLRARAN